MSSTTTTQYYGLTQYTGNDKPDFADNNEAFREVDAALHGVVQSTEGFSGDITALQEAQNALTTEVTGLSADLNTEKAKITALQNKETLQDAEIAGVKADALDMIEAKDEGTAQVATVAVSAGEYFRYNDVLYIATTNIAVGDTIVPNTNCRATNVGTELKGIKAELNRGTVSVTGNGVKTLSTLLDELFAQVNTTKLTNNSKLTEGAFTANIVRNGTTYIEFGLVGRLCQLRSYVVESNGSSATKVDFGISDVTRADRSSEVVNNGVVIAIHY